MSEAPFLQNNLEIRLWQTWILLISGLLVALSRDQPCWLVGISCAASAQLTEHHLKTHHFLKGLVLPSSSLPLSSIRHYYSIVSSAAVLVASCSQFRSWLLPFLPYDKSKWAADAQLSFHLLPFPKCCRPQTVAGTRYLRSVSGKVGFLNFMANVQFGKLNYH